jgi:hypothetical protein
MGEERTVDGLAQVARDGADGKEGLDVGGMLDDGVPDVREHVGAEGCHCWRLLVVGWVKAKVGSVGAR